MSSFSILCSTSFVAVVRWWWR